MPRTVFVPASWDTARRRSRRDGGQYDYPTPPRRAPRRRLPREKCPPRFPPVHEAAFLEQLRPLLNHYGWRWYHTLRSDGSNGGFPDLRAVHAVRGEAIYAELKGWNGRIEPAQVDWLDDLTATGHRCYLWFPWHFAEANTVLTDAVAGQEIPRWPYGGAS